MNRQTGAEGDEVERLLPMIRRGSNAAFLRLSELYAPLLESEVARYAASLPPADLDDLRQSASVSLYRAAVAFSGDRGVTFGLFAKICVVNGIADSLRYVYQRFFLCRDCLAYRKKSEVGGQRSLQNQEKTQTKSKTTDVIVGYICPNSLKHRALEMQRCRFESVLGQKTIYHLEAR